MAAGEYDGQEISLTQNERASQMVICDSAGVRLTQRGSVSIHMDSVSAG